MMVAMRKARRSREQWREIIRQQRGSRLSVAAFCRRAKVAPASFFAWRRKLQDAVSFAEVKVMPEPVDELGGIELHLARQRCVVVRPGFYRRTLLDLLAALEGEA